ncbi:MAG TPA: hypothetical protein PKD54_01030 [Pirellulaceae bacterium]|nr:hypothetical protein [Pirellulaceae bacterium]
MNTVQHLQHQVEHQVAVDRHRHSSANNQRGTGTEVSLMAPIRALESGNHEEAFRLLKTMGSAPEVVNLRAVCLMRMGQAHEALALMRGLVLQPGCTWMRSPIPISWQINYATSLLMCGLPAGCVDVLDEIDNESLLSVKQIRSTIEAWSKTLPLIARWQWWLGRVAPHQCRFALSFEPGTWIDA